MTLNILNVAKICRICLAEGARNIFERTTTTHCGGIEHVASLENLLEKMRFVTMAQIKENDTLPKMICDNCIVQLNVSYNFKRKAMENDLKLRQYIIEKGLDTTIDENSGNASALYYTPNISIMHNTLENVEHHQHINTPNHISVYNPVTNPGSDDNAVVCEKDVPANHINRTISHHIPIKVELVDSPPTTECVNSRFIPEQNLPNPNLMVMVNDNNNLLTQSIPSSNSTSTIPSSGSSSFTNENNLRDSEFLRNYVQNKINFDATIEKRTNKPVKTFTRKKLLLYSQQDDKFLKKYIKKNLDSMRQPNSPAGNDNFKVSLDLKNLIMDQKENFRSVLKMRQNNKRLRRIEQKPVKQLIRTKKEVNRLKKNKNLDNLVIATEPGN